ncbi:MAG: hypothetical protein ACRDTJ_15125 [Pseudonocardiaceae bacterium]
MWPHKTVPWRRARYKARLDEADALRQEIADELELDPSKSGFGRYPPQLFCYSLQAAEGGDGASVQVHIGPAQREGFSPPQAPHHQQHRERVQPMPPSSRQTSAARCASLPRRYVGEDARAGAWYGMHMSLSERTQVLLTAEQRRRVEQVAARSSVSVGAVIRAAIDAYLPSAPPEQRRRALDDLFSLDAPVADWAVMEAEIEAGYRS